MNPIQLHSFVSLALLSLAFLHFAPEPTHAEEPLPEPLPGTHPFVRGAGDTRTSGEVTIKAAGDVLLFDWSGESGAGLRQGNMIGVLRKEGVALYEIVPEANGVSLVGYRADHGSDAATQEAIFIGESDIETVAQGLPPMNGRYVAFRQTPEGRLEIGMTIAGDSKVKSVERRILHEILPGIGLQLGDTIATVDPSGLGVYTKTLDAEEEPMLEGLRLQSNSNEPVEETLVPAFD